MAPGSPECMRGLVASFVVLALAACGGGSSTKSTVAPPFSSSQLSELPTSNWLTNGGTLANDRYSPLTEIDTGNVSRLKGVWHVHLKDAVAAKYSAEAQPIVYQGVMYVATGTDDVFA